MEKFHADGLEQKQKQKNVRGMDTNRLSCKLKRLKISRFIRKSAKAGNIRKRKSHISFTNYKEIKITTGTGGGGALLIMDYIGGSVRKGYLFRDGGI